MQRLSRQAASEDIYNDLFILMYLLHKQTLGGFDLLKEGRLEEGDARDLAKIYIAQIIELVKNLRLSDSPGTQSKETTYQVLQKYLLARYIQKHHFSADEKDIAVGFAEKMLDACFNYYSDEKLKSEFIALGDLVSDNGIRLFYKKVEWGMDLKFDLNWSVNFPESENSIKSLRRRCREQPWAGAALESLPVKEEVYLQPASSQPDYNAYYEWKAAEDANKLAKFQHDFKHHLLQTTYEAVFNELKRYLEMPRINWIGRFFRMTPANVEIANLFLLNLREIRRNKNFSNIEKLIEINELFYDVVDILRQASSTRLLPIVRGLHRDFLDSLQLGGLIENEEVLPVKSNKS